MRILEVSREPLLKSVCRAQTDWLSLKPPLEPSRREYDHLSTGFGELMLLGWRLLWREYAVILLPAVHGGWPHDLSRLKRCVRRGLAALSRQPLASRLIAWGLGTGTKIGVYDFDDHPGISSETMRLIPNLSCYFKRELNAADPKRDARIRFLPYALERTPFDAVHAAEKTTDIFYAASLNSPEREEATQVLRQMGNDGFQIDMPEGRMNRDEFLRRLAAAWLAVAPQGCGWHSYRQYEAGFLGTVPVSNRPAGPWANAVYELQDGEHCFYYQAGTGQLRTVLEQALADKEKLARMASSIQQLCRERHTREAVARYILRTLGLEPDAGVECRPPA
ncbi:MAG: glycosyltransferase family 1 protein [Verrucomicrobia bacterium]|nr:glycosyltransferase family 1 protein [Verrucomicrobiota bacterium]